MLTMTEQNPCYIMCKDNFISMQQSVINSQVETGGSSSPETSVAPLTALLPEEE